MLGEENEDEMIPGIVTCSVPNSDSLDLFNEREPNDDNKITVHCPPNFKLRVCLFIYLFIYLFINEKNHSIGHDINSLNVYYRWYF